MLVVYFSVCRKTSEASINHESLLPTRFPLQESVYTVRLDYITIVCFIFQCMQEDVRLSDPDSTVKVHADKPHLVSLGSGRLSTAVTIIPLQNGKIIGHIV